MGLLEKIFNNKKKIIKNGTGSKIRRIRMAKKISASELGKAVGVNETAIRNYETGYRQVSSEKLFLVAQKLGVPVETLIDRQIDNRLDTMHILFELSEKYELMPVKLLQEPQYAIQTKDDIVLKGIEAWYNKRRQWESGKITLEELQTWMDAFPLMDGDTDGDDIQNLKSYYTELKLLISLKSTLDSIELIMNTKMDEIEACYAQKDYKMAYARLRELRSTIITIIQVERKKY